VRFQQPTEEHLAAWKTWLAERPEVIQQLGNRFEPWTLFRLKSTGQRVTVCGFNESGTVTVNVSGEFNLVSHERSVFGIDPNDLMECDLPSDDELLGTIDLSVEEVRELMQLEPGARQLRTLALAVERPLRTYPRNWRTAAS
jgi:hypothetical protein